MHQTGAGRELWFVYDENDQPYMLITRYGTTVDEYFYLLNAQGDVVGIINRFGTLVATYSYDPFGAPVATWTHANDNVGALNPLRYRGYFYDFESGFYYLQSRYYDPVIGRFISADTFATTDAQGFLSCNMFAYCENDPVNREDPTGEWAQLVVGAAVGAVFGGISAAVSSWQTSGTVNLKTVLLGAGVGAVEGLIGATGWNWVAQAASSGVLSGASNIATSLMNGEKVNWGSAIGDTLIGIGSSLIGSSSTFIARKTADTSIAKGISKIETGLSKKISGDRYWKGVTKKGVRMFREGVHSRNVARGRASVRGSCSGGIVSVIKSICM